MWAPKLDQSEALKRMAETFIECVVNGKDPVNDGKAGYRVVKMLEAADRSLKKKGEIVYL
jgi:predicted dehydrogenase